MNNTTTAFLRNALLAIVFSGGILMTVNYWIDPWRYFADSDYAIQDSVARQQNPGIARNKQFRSIAIGTSMSHMFDPDEMGAVFSAPAAIMSISSGTAYEQFLTLNIALQHQKIEHVIWEIHPGAFVVDPQQSRAASLPAYLYDDSALNDILYLYNASNFISSAEQWWQHLRGKQGKRQDWRNPRHEHHNAKHGCPALVKEQINEGGDPLGAADLNYRAANISDNVRQHLLQLVQQYPEVQFHFFLPPFSKLYWALLSENQPIRMRAYQDVALIAATELIGSPNVRLHDLRVADTVTAQLENYRDLTHYSPAVSRWILTELTTDRFRVTADALDQLATRLENWTRGYAFDQHFNDCREQSTLIAR